MKEEKEHKRKMQEIVEPDPTKYEDALRIVQGDPDDFYQEEIDQANATIDQHNRKVEDELFKHSGFSSRAEYDFNNLLIGYQNYYFARISAEQEIAKLNNLLIGKSKTVDEDQAIRNLTQKIQAIFNGDDFRQHCERMVDSEYVKSRYVAPGNLYYRGPTYVKNTFYVEPKFYGDNQVRYQKRGQFSPDERVWLVQRERMLSSLLQLKTPFLVV